jgi:hypothetical protein
MWRVRCGAAAALVAALVTLGCGDGGAVGKVSGTVTYDGRPLERGQIKFVPASGPTAGAVIEDGKYTVTKVSVGTAKVTISGIKAAGKKKLYDTPDAPERGLAQELLPAKYNEKSELSFEVKRGANEKNWELVK